MLTRRHNWLLWCVLLACCLQAYLFCHAQLLALVRRTRTSADVLAILLESESAVVADGTANAAGTSIMWNDEIELTESEGMYAALDTALSFCTRTVLLYRI